MVAVYLSDSTLSKLSTPVATQPTTLASNKVQQTAASTSGFGDAVTLNLSPAAQAVVASSNTQDSNTDTTAAPPPPPPKAAPAGGGGVSVDDTTDVTAIKRKIAGEVGVTGASEVVDDKGNIDQQKLTELLAGQA